VRVLATKTEFKTIASKIIQHPAVTIERIKLRRRVIELSVQTRSGGAAASVTQQRPLIARYSWPPDSAASAKSRDCDNVRSLHGRCNETHSLS
jgi:hypothetical protein